MNTTKLIRRRIGAVLITAAVPLALGAGAGNAHADPTTQLAAGECTLQPVCSGPAVPPSGSGEEPPSRKDIIGCLGGLAFAIGGGPLGWIGAAGGCVYGLS